VYFRNLHRYQQWTLAGTVAACADGVEDCLKGVAVTLFLEGQQVAQGVTDCYGEFRLNRLSPLRQTYTLTLACNGYAPLQTVTELHASTTLPVTFMHPVSEVSR
jgi:hypothetical protein